jgi:hypothetical protein
MVLVVEEVKQNTRHKTQFFLSLHHHFVADHSLPFLLIGVKHH